MDELLTSYGDLPLSIVDGLSTTSVNSRSVAATASGESCSDCSADTSDNTSGTCSCTSDCGDNVSPCHDTSCSSDGTCTSDCNDTTCLLDGVCEYDTSCPTDGGECKDVCKDTCYDCTDAAGAYYTYSVTDTSITITIHGLEAGVSTYRFFCYLISDDGIQIDVIPSDYYGTKTASSSTHSCTVSRDKKSSYKINAAVNSETLTATTIDAETSIDVEPWSWDASLERQNFYNVMKESDSGRLPADPKNLSHVVWNDLLDKVHELSIATEATSSGWDVTYGTLDESYCYSGQNLTAQKYNALRQNVNRICSKVGIDSLLMEGISQVVIGDRIYGKHFILPANKINECIATGG